MLQPVSIIAELEEAIRSGSSANQISTLRQVTDLFLRDADRLNEDQVRVFDDVLSHLVARVKTTTARWFGLAWPHGLGRDTPDPNTSASQNSFVTVLIWIAPRTWGE
jgi:hypothetical protein